jgi:hypothetical protein
MNPELNPISPNYQPGQTPSTPQKKSKKVVISILVILVAVLLITFGPVVWYMGIGISFGSWLTNIAASNNNPALCKFVPSTYDGNTSPSSCYRKVAVHNADITVCEKTLGKEYCYMEVGYVLERKAIEEHRINFCTQIVDSEQRQLCYMKYALTFGEVSACDFQTENADKNYCLARINKATSYCTNITDTERLNPYNTWDSSGVVSGVYFSKPSDACIFDIAVVNGNKEMCDQVSKQYNEQNIDKCYAIVDNDIASYCSKNTIWDNCVSFMTDVVNKVKSTKY